jgi:hypothetical protein
MSTEKPKSNKKTIFIIVAIVLILTIIISVIAIFYLKPDVTNFTNTFLPNSSKKTLSADENNNVVVLEKCNLGIKYPNKLKFKGENLEIKPKQEKTPEPSNFLDSMYLNSDNLKFHQFNLSCYQNVENATIPNQGLVSESVDKLELKNKLGWQIFDAEITDLKQMKFYEKPEEGNTYTGSNYIQFKYENIIYSINYYDRNPKIEELRDNPFIEMYKQEEFFDKSGIFANQLQLQFESILKSEANTSITSSSSSVSSVESSAAVSQESLKSEEISQSQKTDSENKSSLANSSQTVSQASTKTESSSQNSSK